MGLSDKITGRVKKTAGEVLGKEDMRRQGSKEERKGEAEDEAKQSEQEAVEKRREAANLDRKT
jgi:uncharacterized protein YjbJ (UPF0337 family)